MKAIKIILAIVVTAAIGFFVRQWVVTIDDTETPTPVENQFIKRIKSEIGSLRDSSANIFYREFYDAIQYRIEDYHAQNLLGDNGDNDRWRGTLSKDLYYAYAPKFAKQAMYVFGGSDWNAGDLSFIKSETAELMGSDLLQQGPVKDSFRQIQQILSKYYEIEGFVSACRSYSCSSDYSMASRFPIDEAKEKIDRANAYRANILNHAYLNNCTRLHDGLKAVPQALFDAHISYLNAKIRNWAGKFSSHCSSHKDYRQTLYQSLKDEIKLLDNDIYEVSSFGSEYDKLIHALNSDDANAYDYFGSSNY